MVADLLVLPPASGDVDHDLWFEADTDEPEAIIAADDLALAVWLRFGGMLAAIPAVREVITETFDALREPGTDSAQPAATLAGGIPGPPGGRIRILDVADHPHTGPEPEEDRAQEAPPSVAGGSDDSGWRDDAVRGDRAGPGRRRGQGR